MQEACDAKHSEECICRSNGRIVTVQCVISVTVLTRVEMMYHGRRPVKVWMLNWMSKGWKYWAGDRNRNPILKSFRVVEIASHTVTLQDQ